MITFQTEKKIEKVTDLTKIPSYKEYKQVAIIPIKDNLWEVEYKLLPMKEIDRVLSDFQGKKNSSFIIPLVEVRWFPVEENKQVSYHVLTGETKVEKGYQFHARGRNFYLVDKSIYDESGFVACSEFSPLGVVKKFFTDIYKRIDEIPDLVKNMICNKYLCYESSIICIL